MKARRKQQKQDLCPLGRAVDDRSAWKARMRHKPVLGTPCQHEACAWWSEKHRACAVVALVEVMESSRTEPVKATTEALQTPESDDNGLKPLPQHVRGWISRLKESE